MQRNHLTADVSKTIDFEAQIVKLSALANAYRLSEDHTAAEELNHARICRQLAQLLLEEDRIPEAMPYFQDATDTYGRVQGHEADAASCAQEIMRGIRVLWKRPGERLYLLIERINREKS